MSKYEDNVAAILNNVPSHCTSSGEHLHADLDKIRREGPILTVH